MDHISRIGMFLEVAKHESFAAAARSLGVTGPALSKQVQALEDQLGVRLLHRTTRLVTLTEEGALYSDRARKALEDLHEAEQQIQELKACPTGLLRVNAPMSFGKRFLAQPIAAFARDYPEVTLEVDFDDRRVDVLAEGYDVVIRIGALEDSSLIARKIADCPILMCASPELVTQYGKPKHPKELSHWPGVIYSKHGISNEWRYRAADGSTGQVTLNRTLAANNAEMMLEACLSGVGVALLPVFSAATHIKAGQLVRLLPKFHTHPERGIYALFPQNRHMLTRVRLFVDWITESSKAFPW
ncbi:MAG: LysR substrate-binding domain-containing protein [Rickettsiales bacterium]|nr:LysR substrate-binding domain-containing protein [Rickettsiales bacterium]